MRVWTLCTLAGLVIAGSQRLHAETAARQSFIVNIPRRLTITAPPAAAQAEMDQNAVQVTLPAQRWSIASNTRDGATVRLSTLHSFHNLDDATIRRDAELEVQIQSQSRPVPGRSPSPLPRRITWQVRKRPVSNCDRRGPVRPISA